MANTDFSRLNDKEARELLITWRNNEERRGPDAVELGARLLSRDPGAFGDKVWDVYEYVGLAALDCAKTKLAELCINRLKAKFPSSQRVRKLEAMLHEAEGHFDAALAIYTEMLEDNPVDQDVRKREIAVIKAQGNRALAIHRLTAYLGVYMADYEAWMELAAIYLDDLNYEQAAFCVEELLTSNPNDDDYFTLYAEIHYALGNYLMARKYFSKAVDLNPKNMKALWGLHEACLRYEGGGKTDNEELADWARDKILAAYKDSDKLATVASSIRSAPQ